eukprot:14295124-Ditylum_brightwellii.AAC.1
MGVTCTREDELVVFTQHPFLGRNHVYSAKMGYTVVSCGKVSDIDYHLPGQDTLANFVGAQL